ncbi:glycosyltransferase family 15 protein [Ascoidea rubescens DSM 1968]|uniref:Glycosyltransferase family 15 protein n=1 Tax=Ascoidea rubescens DSM 1968 TaxID=1344418 RepID=A0A1D2VMN4_9ASCO|nr:glycosyltransferase family 15 protein [Ascoidea rubescens DSM 1968]ODV62844.1 glycosyltransferase family 15 protein [Ascoidea rubescens DSM 1968]
MQNFVTFVFSRLKKLSRELRLFLTVFVAIIFVSLILLSLNYSDQKETSLIPPKKYIKNLQKNHQPIAGKHDYQDFFKEFEDAEYDLIKSTKANATFVTLARNSDVWGMVKSIRSVEDRFNRKFHYDWVFLNDEEFSEEFIDATTAVCSGKTKYGVIPVEQWSFPSFINTEKVDKNRARLKKLGIIYGDSISYRHMCRYESGFFWRHPLVNEYEWYWRVEPDISFHCDINYDLFKYMEINNQTYGFAISLKEFHKTIPSLWKHTKLFLKKNPDYLHQNNLMDFLSEDNGHTYNLCHFWSNFEIGNLNFFRSQKYREYFDHLDKTGGFFYERWGDAPIHSMAVSLFEDKEKIHFFDDIGYTHDIFTSCPISKKFRKDNHCACNPNDDFAWRSYSCTGRYFDVKGLKKPDGWEDYT